MWTVIPQFRCARTTISRAAGVLLAVAIGTTSSPADAGRFGRQIIGCVDAPPALANGSAGTAGARGDVRITALSAVPDAQSILTSARAIDSERLSFNVEKPSRRDPAVVDVRLEGVRDLEIPGSLSDDLVYQDIRSTRVVNDPRSSIANLWRVEEATVIASDLAYDVKERRTPDLRERGQLAPDRARELTGYTVVATYLDAYTGFKAVAFERQDPAPGEAHRIYAIAGTQVFVNTDFRDWAAGLTMARSHMVSTAALRLIADAAAYASDPAHGGEVFVTGQSQGAVTAQGIGFLLQEYLDAGAGANATRHAGTFAGEDHLVHVVSWGAVGALQPIVTLIQRQREGAGRDFPPPFERHWAVADPDHDGAMAVWSRLAKAWSRLDDAAIRPHIDAVAQHMRVVGYFYEIDPFARAGTFLGTSMVLPTAFVLPTDCEQLVTELMFQTRAGNIGITLESHFLKGYQRAVERGALAVARPAETGKWDWVTDLLPIGDVIGKAWLSEIYRDGILASEANWRTCTTAKQWRTDRNSRCRRGYWPGCSREPVPTGGEAGVTADGARWCLIDRATPPGEASPALAAKPVSGF